MDQTLDSADHVEANVNADEMALKLVNNISRALDHVNSCVNTLRYHCIANPDLRDSNKYEDFLESHWKPLSLQIFNCQTEINQTLMQEQKSSIDVDLDEILPPLFSLSSLDTEENLTPSIPTFDSDNDEEEFVSVEPNHCSTIVDPDTVRDIMESKDAFSSAESLELDIMPLPEEEATTKVKDETISLIFENLKTSEKTYREVLYCLNMLYQAILSVVMDDLNSALYTDTKRLFGKIPDILEFHTKWIEVLENENSVITELNMIATFFVSLRSYLVIYKEHCLNCEFPMEALQKLANHKELFKRIPKVITASNIKIALDDALKRPASRMSEYCTMITDILLHISDKHSLYNNLNDVKDEFFIFCEILRLYSKDKKITSRHVVKWSPVVEYICPESRKHRILMLFSDYLICSRESSKNVYSYKWFCSLKKIRLNEDVTDHKLRGQDFIPIPKLFVDQLKDEIHKVQEEIATSNTRKNPKKNDKLLAEYDRLTGKLVLSVPSQPLYLYLADGKKITLLFINPVDRDAWERIIRIRKNSDIIEFRPIYIGEVNECIEAISQNIQDSFKEKTSQTLNSHRTTAADSSASVARFNGVLYVKGLSHRNPSSNAANADIILNFEMDKHLKGYKPTAKNSKIGWTNTDIFSLELENSPGYLYITSSRGKNRSSDNVGTFVIYLAGEKIKEVPYIRRKKTFNWGEVLVLLEYHENGSPCTHLVIFNSYQPSIEKISQCEGSDIPTVIKYSIQNIEERGMDEAGIYRISGIASQIIQCRQLWMDGFVMSPHDINDFEVHVVAGNLKQFLRELDEPLISYNILINLVNFDYTNSSYEQFIDILNEMDQPSRMSFMMILYHLIELPKYPINKMSFKSISTVFGVNLLAAKSPDDKYLDMGVQLSTFIKILEFWDLNAPTRDQTQLKFKV